MSTFLQTLAVVVLSIAAATAVAVKDPSQPATLNEHARREPGKEWWRRLGRGALAWLRALADRVERMRARRRRTRSARPPTLRPQKDPAAALTATVPVGTGRLTENWLPARPRSPWARARSGVLLTILLTVIGVIVAASVAGLVLAAALALRSAVS